MSLWHKHKWEVTGKKFHSPEMSVTQASGHLSESVEMLLWGYTAVTSKCQGCGQIKNERFIGEVEL